MVRNVLVRHPNNSFLNSSHMRSNYWEWTHKRLLFLSTVWIVLLLTTANNAAAEVTPNSTTSAAEQVSQEVTTVIPIGEMEPQKSTLSISQESTSRHTAPTEDTPVPTETTHAGLTTISVGSGTSVAVENCTDGNPCLRTPPCVLLENVTCLRDSVNPCRPRFFSVLDASEVLCNPNEKTYCEFSTTQLTCPSGWRIKMWFAMFGPAPSHICPPPSPSEPSPFAESSHMASWTGLSHSGCSTQSILWELAQVCDALEECSFNVTEEALGLTECPDTVPKFLRLEYICLGTSKPNAKQTRFFVLVLISIFVLFLLTILVLFVTVHFKKKKKDSYPMNSLHAPLTDHENPEV